MRQVKIFPVRIIEKENGKKEKRPAISGWQHSVLRRDQIATPCYGVVIPEGTILLDFDTENAKPELEAKFGIELISDALLQFTSRGVHYGFSVPEGVELEQGSNKLGIKGFDTRTAGKGWACTGEGYKLVGDVIETRFAGNLPPLPKKLLDALTRARTDNVVTIPTAAPPRTDRTDAEEVKDAIRYITPDNYDIWVKVGMALQAVPSGFAIWDGWSQQSSKYDANEMGRKWASFAGTSVMPNTIFWMAQQAGWENPKKGQALAVVDDFDNLVPEGEDGSGGEVNVWEPWVFLQHSNTFRDANTGLEMSVQAFNLSMSRYPTFVQAGDRVKEVKPAEYHIKHSGGKSVYSPIYAPHAGKFFDFQGAARVNSYLHDAVPTADSDWAVHEAWRLVERHFLTSFIDEADGLLLIEWMAHNVQRPGKKILWAPIICGVPGDGKSTVKNILDAVMGDQNVREVGPDEVFSAFNSYAEGACVCALEEVRFKGHNRHDVMNKLKPLLTNKTVSVVKKGRDALQVPNATNYIAFTNHPDALALDKDDRRWGVFFTKYESREQLLADRGESYWEELHGAYQNNPRVIRGWLESIKLDDFNPNAAPAMNAAKDRMINESRSVDAKVIIEALDEMEDIFNVQSVVDKANRMGARTNVSAVGALLKDLGYIKLSRMRIHGTRMMLWAGHTWGGLKLDHEAMRLEIERMMPNNPF